MTTQGPLGGSSRDPYDNSFRPEPIREGASASEREEEVSLAKHKKKFAIPSFLLQMLHTTIDQFLGQTDALEKGLQDHLFRLKTCFENLQKKDQSQDLQFLTELSVVWHQILEDTFHLKQSSASNQLNNLIKKIQLYPSKKTHTLGYYLMEYAGQKWIPVPYMDLLQALHLEYVNNPHSSALAMWAANIAEIMVLLKVE